MANHNGADQNSQRDERALAATHEICCSVCGGQQWYEYVNRLTEAVAIAQAQAQAEAAYSRQLHSERQMLLIAFGEAIHHMCRVRQRLEVN
uniref:Zf-HC2 domain-containing protein n=1 Tax=Haemonchus placei TaxID=6290 RepID=A0A0N4WPX4_HAEPC